MYESWHSTAQVLNFRMLVSIVSVILSIMCGSILSLAAHHTRESIDPTQDAPGYTVTLACVSGSVSKAV